MRSDPAGLDAALHDRGQDDWVSVAEVMDVGRNFGFPYSLDAALDCIERLHSSARVRVGTYERGFVPWTEPINNLRERIREAVNTPDPNLGLMNTLLDFTEAR